MVQQVLPLLVGNLGLAFDGVEIDVVFEHPGQGVVFLFHGGNGLVEHVADVVLEVLERRNLIAVLVDPGFMPAGAHGNKEGLAVGGLVFQQFLDEIRLILQMGKVFLAQLLALAVELIGQALEEQHAEDEFLELRGIHLAAQNVGGLKEKGFELGEGDFFSGQILFLPIKRPCVLIMRQGLLGRLILPKLRLGGKINGKLNG